MKNAIGVVFVRGSLALDSFVSSRMRRLMRGCIGARAMLADGSGGAGGVIGVFDLSEDLRFADDHGIQGGGDAEEMLDRGAFGVLVDVGLETLRRDAVDGREEGDEFIGRSGWPDARPPTYNSTRLQVERMTSSAAGCAILNCSRAWVKRAGEKATLSRTSSGAVWWFTPR